VFAPQTLGDDVEIELWYLAEHFLLAWHDWHGLCERFPRYFGEPERSLPTTWRQFDADCAVLADQLLRDKQLDIMISKFWSKPGVFSRGWQQEVPSTLEVYHTVVQNHRRWSLIRKAETGQLGPQTGQFPKSRSEGEIWPKCRELVISLNMEALLISQRLMEMLDGDLRFHLRHYCHANLLVSWLTDDNERSMAPGSGSTLFQLLSEKVMSPSINDYAKQLPDPGLRVTAMNVLERITQAIREIGYDDFVEDLISGDFRGGPDSLVGANSINLIPSAVPGGCQSLLLAVSKGNKGALGFASIMRQVRERLILCPGTKSVIILGDNWLFPCLKESLGDLRAHHRKGVRFLFLLVGFPRRFVEPVEVDLGLAP
jgi:hypothetical protein